LRSPEERGLHRGRRGLRDNGQQPLALAVDLLSLQDADGLPASHQRHHHCGVLAGPLDRTLSHCLPQRRAAPGEYRARRWLG